MADPMLPRASQTVGGAELSRKPMIEAAAKALTLDPTTAPFIAAAEPSAFVQTVRKTFKAHGFNFTDDDLREIHQTLRRMLLERKYNLGRT